MPNTSSPDLSGKQDFGDIYDAADPRAYWRALAPLGYRIPGHAQGVYHELVEARRRVADDRRVTVTDLCCSYGTTGALLKHTCTVEDLWRRYCSEELDALPSDELVARDAAFFAERRRPSPPRVVGLDTAANAVAYALQAGLLDAGCAENLEEAEPSPRLQALLADTDLITVTGGVGYIGARTFDRVLAQVPRGRHPWVGAFVLRWIDYAPVVDALGQHGLVTEELTVRTFPQRRFADDGERHHVLSTLDGMGIDPQGKEADGQHHAAFYLSRPAQDVTDRPVDDWFAA